MSSSSTPLSVRKKESWIFHCTLKVKIYCSFKFSRVVCSCCGYEWKLMKNRKNFFAQITILNWKSILVTMTREKRKKTTALRYFLRTHWWPIKMLAAIKCVKRTKEDLPACKKSSLCFSFLLVDGINFTKVGIVHNWILSHTHTNLSLFMSFSL